MTDSPRTQASRSAATRDALINAARPLFAERGFAGVGTEEIVREAGVTRGALYHHFEDKTALFAAVFEAVESGVTDRIATAAANSGESDPIEVMRVGATTWLDACVEPEVHRIVLVDAPAVLGWERWTEIGDRYNLGLVQALLAQAVEIGRIPQQPVEPLAHTLLGAVRESAQYIARAADQGQARIDVGAVLDRMISALAAG